MIGKVGRPHGVHGELRITPTGPTLASIREGDSVVLRRGNGSTAGHRIEAMRPANDVVLARLEGIGTREAAADLTGCEVVVEAARLAVLPEADEFYVRDLVGCDVRTREGPIGTVVDVHEGAANDALVVRRDTDEILVPFTHDAVTAVDLAGRVVTIRSDLLVEE